MSFYADPSQDLPALWKPKRCIFYAQGLKIYGQIPYILQRRLQAEFFSNNAPAFGGRIIAPTVEQNYTVVPYRRRDGAPHSQGTIDTLMDWLFADKGLEWAIAKDFDREIRGWNAYQMPPQTWIPTTEETQSEFVRLLTDGGRHAVVAGSSET